MTAFNIIILIITVVLAFINRFIMASHHSCGVENRKSLNIKFLLSSILFSQKQNPGQSSSQKKKILYISQRLEILSNGLLSRCPPTGRGVVAATSDHHATPPLRVIHDNVPQTP